MTNEEWVNQQIEENKKYYHSADVLINEIIKLLEGIKKLPDDQKWRIITAVNEAYHVALVVSDAKKRADRLVNTIASFIKDNVAV